MKKGILILLLSIFAWYVHGGILRVATYNVRTEAFSQTNGEDFTSGNQWEKRRPHVVNILINQNLDIIGLQETTYRQAQQLKSLVNNYSYNFVSECRNGCGEICNNTCWHDHGPIMYNINKYEVLNRGTFWLSDTPNQKGSQYNNSECPRICTWAKFKVKNTNYIFFVFNTHMYLHSGDGIHHIEGVGRQIKSIELINLKIKEIAGDSPVIVMGDFNSQSVIAYGLKTSPDAYNFMKGVCGFQDCYTVNRDTTITSTVNDFRRPIYLNNLWGIIDHIFIKGNFTVNSYSIIVDSYEDGNIRRYPSDHFPVVVSLTY